MFCFAAAPFYLRSGKCDLIHHTGYRLWLRIFNRPAARLEGRTSKSWRCGGKNNFASRTGGAGGEALAVSVRADAYLEVRVTSTASGRQAMRTGTKRELPMPADTFSGTLRPS